MKAIALAATALIGVAVACSSSDSSSDCNCSVEVNGEKKDLTCGQQACVGGFSYTCADTGATRGGSACGGATSSSGSTSSGSTSSGSSTSGSTTSSSSSGTPNDACASLAYFCATKCKAPPNSDTLVNNCKDTVSEGDGKKCVAWQSTNGALCRAQ